MMKWNPRTRILSWERMLIMNDSLPKPPGALSKQMERFSEIFTPNCMRLPLFEIFVQ